MTFTATSPDPNAIPLTLTDNISRPYGELSGSANIINKGIGWSAFGITSWKFNDQFTTWSGRAGVRYQWM